MSKSLKIVCLAAVALCVLAVGVFVVVAQEDTEGRKAAILANIKMHYAQLADIELTMGEITPTEFAGLDEGSFTIPGRGAQKFLVSHDNKKLYLTGDPIDVSKSESEIQTWLAEREAAKAREAAERQDKLNEIAMGQPTRGNPDAKVLIVEFSDFQCPYCARGASTMEQVLKKYPDDVKFVFKHFPLNFHPWAKSAAIASRCAAEQSADAFWKLHDEYFKSQKSLTPDNVMEKSKGYLEGTDIDMAKWSTCAEKEDSEAYKAAVAMVEADMELGKSLGVSGTPGFFVNGEFLNGAQPLSAFEPLIQKASM